MSNQFYAQVASVEKNTKATRGGLWSIYYCPVEEVQQYPDANPATALLEAPFTVTAWYRLAVSNYKKGYKEEPRKGDAGDYLEITVSAFIPFETQQSHLLLDRLKYHRYILLVKTPAGLVMVLGTWENPVRFAQAGNSGEEPKDVTGTAVSFSWTTEDKPRLYTGVIDPIL